MLRPRRAKAPPGPTTLYFNDAGEDGDWSNASSWWADPGHTIQAGTLPGPTTNVVISAAVTGNTSEVGQCLNMTASGSIGIAVYVFGLATFTGTATMYGSISGSAVFRDSSVMAGDVFTSATFEDSACYASGTSDLFIPGSPPQCA